MNVSAGNIDGTTPARPSTPAPNSEFATDTFTKSDALESALAAAPDVRTDAVTRARALISDSNYPSPNAIKQISDFFAVKFSSNE